MVADANNRLAAAISTPTTRSVGTARRCSRTTGRAVTTTARSVSTAVVRVTATVYRGSASPPESRATRNRPNAAEERMARRTPRRSRDTGPASTRRTFREMSTMPARVETMPASCSAPSRSPVAVPQSTGTSAAPAMIGEMTLMSTRASARYCRTTPRLPIAPPTAGAASAVRGGWSGAVTASSESSESEAKTWPPRAAVHAVERRDSSPARKSDVPHEKLASRARRAAVTGVRAQEEASSPPEVAPSPSAPGSRPTSSPSQL